MSAPGAPEGHDQKSGLAALALGALGVVYGDIGTSPLYAMKVAFTGHQALPSTPMNVYGVLSLIFWALTFVISFKYIGFVLRADNRGEGGIMALLGLVRSRKASGRGQAVLLGLGLLWAALLYGEGVITPAISVLGAVEGIRLVSPGFGALVVPIAVLILVGLFWVQQYGVERIGRAFGPIMVAWFLCIAALGVRGIAMHPEVLRAINPWYAAEFLTADRLDGFLILGAVVLVVTGGEALYAHMGHCGRRPIQWAWFCVALPALVLNYFGQAALLLETPGVGNPFYALAPDWFLLPLIGVATLAALIASQALITTAYSLTRQAVQLGYSPRVTIVYTSRTQTGRIYLPEVNKALAVGCILLVLGFRSSTNLAAAYGIAVTGTMAISTLLFYRVVRDLWRWRLLAATALCLLFLVVDLSFFGANIIKFTEGGWFPIVVAGAVYTLMVTWKQGRAQLTAMVRQASLPIDLFVADVARRSPVRVPGTAVVLTSALDIAPPVLLHHLKHNKVLHERIILLSIVTEEVPQVTESERVECRTLGQGFWRVVGHYGFMESPDVPTFLAELGASAEAGGLGPVVLNQTSFFLGRETLIALPRSQLPKRLPGDPRPMAYLRRRLFIIMTRNARSATAFFGLPPNRVIELGAQIQI